MLTRLLRTYLRRYLRQVGVVVALLAVQTFGNLYLPNLNADIINFGVVKGNVHYIWTTGAFMLAIALVLGVLSIVAVYYASRVAMGAGADIRGAVFTQVQRFSANEMNHFGTASLITRNTNDIQQIQMFVQMALTLMVIAPIMCVGGIFMAIREDATLSLLLVVAVPVMVLVLAVVMILVVPQFRSMQVKIDRITEVLREQITGVRVIRAFVRGRSESERFDEANSSLTPTPLRVNRVFALTMPALLAILNLSSRSWTPSRRSSTRRPLSGPRGRPAWWSCATSPSATPAASNRSCTTCRWSSCRARPARSSVGPAAARRPCSTSSRGSPTPPVAACSSTALTCGTRSWTSCGTRSGWCRRRRSCSAAPSPATCASASRRLPRRSCGMLSRLLRPATSTRPCPASWTHRSTRAAPTSQEASVSGSRSPGHW